MNDLVKLGGDLDTPKKLYMAPELHVIDIDSTDIICTSPFGEDGEGNMPGMGNENI